MKNNHYRIFVDTGGTFTDCIAIDDTGESVRRKVLSNGTIRGTVTKYLNNTTLQINEKWNLEKDILKGYKFRFLKNHIFLTEVKSFNIPEKTLILKDPLPAGLLTGHLSFELFSGEEAPVLGTRLITGKKLDETLPVREMRLGSTKGTNALLERKGASVALLVTKGFKDILKIRYQDRPDIFARNVIKPEPLFDQAIEVDERISASGNILIQLSSKSIKKALKQLKEKGNIASIAIALMHSWANPVHEEKLKQLVTEAGFSYISISTELSALIKYIPRTETSVVNAYLDPIIQNYLKNIKAKVPKSKFHVMNSAGGLAGYAHFKPKDSLLSGPAGGIVGAVSKGKVSGYEKIISFDMGGTSTDVARYSGSYDYLFDLKVGDARIFSPAFSIETVAAGGGSICYFDGFKLCVGPESAGAFPGPACYGAGGPLTITDVNLLLGHIDIGRFGIPVFPEEAEKQLENLLSEIAERSGKKKEKDQILNGFLQIANEIMAGAIRKVSVSKGFDPADHVLVAFGGAGGMHAASIAELLNIREILLPEDAGLLSAYGIGQASVERFAEKLVLQPFDSLIPVLNEMVRTQENEAIRKVEKEGIPTGEIRVKKKIIYLRKTGQDASLELVYNSPEQLMQNFKSAYNLLYGYWNEADKVEIESIRVIAGTVIAEKTKPEKTRKEYAPVPSHFIRSNVRGKWHKVPVFLRDHLKPGATIEGFALILDDFSTWVVEENWNFFLNENQTGIIKHKKSVPSGTKLANQYEEIELELFTRRFMAIATNMGTMLQRTSVSVNVKERLDFSCSLLDKNGELVANAPHIPVHLGSLGVCVRKIAGEFPMEPGDTIVTNHPRYGGSHLPDITLITPVFTSENTLIGYVVNRAHHAEIGGKTPASMPPDAVNLEEEGVVISPQYLVKKNKVNWDLIRKILSIGAFPSRAVEENIADMNAALAANRKGEKELLKLIEEHSLSKVTTYMTKLKQHASRKMRETLAKIQEGTYFSEEKLDDGSLLKVKVEMIKSSCIIDFTGSGDVHPGNMNATPAIVNGVVIYVMRLLVDENIPLNEGLLEPVRIILPKGLLNPLFPDDPKNCPAIVGGNVEVSQRLTDTLLKPFGILACSQGTMNNVLFGNKHFSYYETICGGCGAGNGFHGASAVHHHMTNTRITDPEIMEFRYPVRLESFSIRKNSGGKGKFKGGDGVIREISFLEITSLSVLTQHRTTSPYGMKNGAPGKPGKQYILRKDGTKKILKPVDGCIVNPGDKLVILTPGGGGFGKEAY